MAIVKNKAVVKLVVTDDKSKKAAQRALVDIDGFSSLTLDFEKSTLVVSGNMDPTVLVKKLRKFVCADLVTFGPEKDEGKSQKADGGGGNLDQKPKQQPPKEQPKQQQPQLLYRPYDGYGCGYNY